MSSSGLPPASSDPFNARSPFGAPDLPGVARSSSVSTSRGTRNSSAASNAPTPSGSPFSSAPPVSSPAAAPPSPSDPPGSPASPGSPGELPDQLFVAADELFGDRLAMAEQYAEILATDAVVRGLIGPRETDRIWDRHILNCAAMHSVVPYESYVADVGSGAGLPGIPLALARPDLRIILIEPLLRRATFLDEVVGRLGLSDRVEVLRGRAEEMISMFHVKPADVATARAVAPLDRLAGWTLPLVRIGGSLLAMKGSTADEEIVEHRKSIQALGGGDPSIVVCGEGLLAEPTIVVKVVREAERPGAQAPDNVRSEKPAARDAKGSRTQGRRR